MKMETYTIYRNPLDYPNNFVVRKYTVEVGRITANIDLHFIGDSLEDARNSIPDIGLVRIERDENDALSIVETWI